MTRFLNIPVHIEIGLAPVGVHQSRATPKRARAALDALTEELLTIVRYIVLDNELVAPRTQNAAKKRR